MHIALDSIDVGPLRPPAERGGDVRLRDLSRGVDVRGPHVFTSSSFIRITNGLLRLDISGPGAVPAVTVSIRRGASIIDDFYSDTYSDTYTGTNVPAEWLGMGTVSFDSTLVVATVTGRVVRCNREIATVRLVAPTVGDIFVTLRRGERMARVQHGTGRGGVVSVTRRIRWSASPALTGTVGSGRVQETTPAYAGLRRFIVARQSCTADGATFLLATTSARVTADFGFGVATDGLLDGVAEHHSQFLGQTKTKLRLAG